MGNAPSSAPYGAQSNAISASFLCDYGVTDPDISQFAINVSYTAPIYGGAGQKINITDINASLELPVRFIVSILDSNAQSYNANTTITFDTTNASPETLVVQEFNTRRNFNYSYLPRDVLRIAVPAPGETPTNTLSIGPITLGSKGQTDVRLRGLDFSIDAFTPDGRPLQVPFKFSCRPKSEPVLASIVVDDTPVQPAVLALANSAPMSKVLSYGQKATTASIPVNCTQSQFIPSGIIFNYTFAGTGPLIAKSGQAFNLTSVNNFVTIPGYLAGGITALWASGTCAVFLRLFPQNGQPGLGLSLANASPASIDVSNTFVASDSSTPNPLVTGRFLTCSDSSNPIQFPFPNWGYLDLTNITPGANGTNFGVSFDVVQGNIEGIEVPYGTTGIERWICTPVHKSVLLSAPIA